MPTSDADREIPGEPEWDDELAILRKARRRNQQYMAGAIAAYALSVAIVVVGTKQLFDGVSRRLEDVRAELRNVEEETRKRTKDVEGSTSRQIAVLKDQVEAELARLKAREDQLRKLDRQTADLKTQLDKQGEELARQLKDARGQIEKERSQTANQLTEAKGKLDELNTTIATYNKQIRQLDDARRSLDAAVFEAGSFVLKEMRETRVQIGREAPSEFFVNLGKVRRDKLEGVWIRNAGGALLHPEHKERIAASDVRIGQPITFEQGGFVCTLTVRYIHEQFFTKDVAGVDVVRRKKE